MSKIVTWGHWIVGLLAAAVAAEIIGGIIDSTVRMYRAGGFGLEDSGWIFLGFGFALVCALCAWGILRWRSWGHVLAVGISAFALFVGNEALLVGDSGPLFPIAALLVLVWLLLPSVRAVYWRRA